MRRLPYALIAALVMMLECPAMADAPPSSSPFPKPRPRQVQKLLDEANAAVRGLDIARARELWAQVRELEHSSVSICQLGQLDRRLGRWTDAAAELSQCFEEMPLPKDARQRATYETRRADLVAVRQLVGAIVVNVSDPGAEIVVDGRRIGVSPLKLPVFVNPGTHRIVAKLGGTQAEEVVAVEAGAEKTARLVLSAAATPAVGTTHAAAPPLAPRADRSGPAPLPSKSGAWLPRWQTVAVVAAPIALAAGGVAALLAANGASEDRDAAIRRIQLGTTQVNRNCPGAGGPCKDFTAADGRLKTMTALSVVSFAGAGVATLGAVYVLYPAGKTPVRVGIGGSSVVFDGSW
jgi:hypothetical protein